MTKEFPYNFNPHANLPGRGEILLHQAIHARVLYGDHQNLREYMVRTALSELLDCCDRDTRDARDVRFWMLMAHVNTQDPAGLREILNYWWEWDTAACREVRTANISKFNPGEHYHVLDEKFPTYDEAMSHLKRKGYELGQFIEQWWPREGD